MKSLLISFINIIFLISTIHSFPVTNINAVYRYGQVFVTWDNTSDQFYMLYKSSSPILHGNQLISAQNLGKVKITSSVNIHAFNRPIRIDSASPPLSPEKGLFVATTTSNGSFYYAVTTMTNNVEDTAIIAGSNSLVSPVNETIDDPRPVWQADTLFAPKLFHIYVWFATKITSAGFPKMTNAGFYPLNFAIVKQGNQSPHPVTYWMRSSIDNFIYQDVWGTGDPNEWIISIDDFTPNDAGGNLTLYYGYHENYDIYNFFSPVPDTGIINNYTAAMVKHTVNWTLRNLPLDSARTYMTGWSLGAIGSIFNSLMMPLKIAAVFLYGPLFNPAPVPFFFMNTLYGTYQTNLFTNEGMRRNERLNVNHLLSINRLNSLPIIYTFCGKNDVNVGWYEKLTFYDSMNVLLHGGFHFWSMSDHFQVLLSNPWQIAAYPPNFSFFTRYRTNLSYPAFSNCSANNNPGNGSPSSGDPIGTINGFLDWNDDIVDSTYKWEITLKTKNLITVYDTLFAPDSCTADVTLRRLQRFNVTSGNRIEWTNTRNNTIVQQGNFIYNGGLITIPDIKIYSSANILKLTNVPIGIIKKGNSIPLRYELYQNYPNPFNPVTKIRFNIPSNLKSQTPNVNLTVYDILGGNVAVLINEQLKPGSYEVDWEASNYSSGTYFYRLTTGNYTETKKMILIK